MLLWGVFRVFEAKAVPDGTDKHWERESCTMVSSKTPEQDAERKAYGSIGLSAIEPSCSKIEPESSSIPLSETDRRSK